MTGDEETLMNRRKTKKAKLAEYRMSKTFFVLQRSKGHACLYRVGVKVTSCACAQARSPK